MKDNKAKLAELFARLGARDPRRWAQSQIEEHMPQLARFLFLRQAWRLVVGEEDDGWITKLLAQAKARPSDPGAGAGAALERLLAQGASRQDLTTVVRVMQWKLLSALCYLLDDPNIEEAEVSDIAWRLFQISEAGKPLAVVSGLQESVLETDPTGREMRPCDSKPA